MYAQTAEVCKAADGGLQSISPLFTCGVLTCIIVCTTMNRWLEENNLKLLVRSHEMKDEGYEVTHNGKCITIFSAPNYCDQVGWLATAHSLLCLAMLVYKHGASIQVCESPTCTTVFCSNLNSSQDNSC
jgi:hypothetical protein